MSQGEILSAERLNSATENIRFLIKNLSSTNSYWFKGNGSSPEITTENIWEWEPVGDGSFYLKKAYPTEEQGDGYMQNNVPGEFGSISGGQLFYAAQCTTSGSGAEYFNGDASLLESAETDYLIRFVIFGGDTWINVQNGDHGTPLYNSGTGAWTIHNVYDMTGYHMLTMTYIKDAITTVEVLWVKAGETIKIPEYEGYVTDYVPTVKDETDTQAITVIYSMTEEKKEAWEAARAALSDALIAADDLYYSEAGYSFSGGPIKLQVTDSSADNYLWTNAPEHTEGPIADLIDGEPGTFFHSRWNDNGFSDDDQPHALYVDLGEGNSLEEFNIRFITRSGAANDFPQEISIEGSNDNNEYIQIAYLNEGMPTSGGNEYVSDVITPEDEYRYLRFVVYKTTTDRIGENKLHNYFHMAEFAIEEPLIEDFTGDERYAEFSSYLVELKELYDRYYVLYEDPDATEESMEAATEEINAAIDFLHALISDADYPATIEYLPTAQEWLKHNGVGTPAEAPRAALQSIVDAATEAPTAAALLKLQAAVETFINTDDVLMPENGKIYTLTFVTTSGHRNYLEFVENDSVTGLVMKPDTTDWSYSAKAAFKCIDNNDGTFSFQMNDGKYLAMPTQNSASGSNTGYALEQDATTAVTFHRLYVNSNTPNATKANFFGLLAWYNGNGAYLTPNSSGSTYYYGSEPHFHPSWTSALAIEEWQDTEENWITGIESIVSENENASKGIYDLSGRRIEKISLPGIYIVNGKKQLVK